MAGVESVVQHVTPSMLELSTIAVNVACSVAHCARTFATPSALRMHLEKVHHEPSSCQLPGSSTWYHCPDNSCRYHLHAQPAHAKHFTRMSNLKQHWLKVHAARVISCKDCNGSFSCERLLSAHRRSCRLTLQCIDCPSSFTSIESLQSHCRRNQHNPTPSTVQDVKTRLEGLAAESIQKKAVCSSVSEEDGASSDAPTCPPLALNLNTITVSGVESHINFDVSYNSSHKTSLFSHSKDNMKEIINAASTTIINNDYNKKSLLLGGFLEDKCIGTMSFIMVNRGTSTCSRVDGGVCSNCEPQSDDKTPMLQTSLTFQNKRTFVKTDSDKHQRSCSFRTKETSVSESKDIGSCSIVQSARTKRSSLLTSPVIIGPGHGCHPPHLLAAIALSELAASAIKRVCSQDACTQTEMESGHRKATRAAQHSSKSCKSRSCDRAVTDSSDVALKTARNFKKTARAAGRRKSAETQTRLTHMEYKNTHWQASCRNCESVSLNSVRCNAKRNNRCLNNTMTSCKRKHWKETYVDIQGIDASVKNPKDPLCNNSENVCVIEAFPSSILIDNPPNPSLSSLNEAQCNSYDNNRKDDHTMLNNFCPENNRKNGNNYVVVNEMNTKVTGTVPLIPLSVELPTVVKSNKSNAVFNSSGTQTSPKAMVSVGIVTHQDLYEDIALTFMEDCKPTASCLPTSHDKGLLTVQDVYGLSGSAYNSISIKSLQPEENCIENKNASLEHNDVFSLTNGNSLSSLAENEHCNEKTIEHSYSSNATETVNKNTSSLGTETSNYSNENLLLEDEKEYVIRDRNLSEMSPNNDLNSSSENMKTQLVLFQQPKFRRHPKLYEIRSSSIETQTEHDVLLSLSASSSNSYLDSPEETMDGVASQSAWCSIETQTCEEFSDIEQFLCSTTQTQTPDQVRVELFPELSFAHSQTQTALEDYPYLVHSHTQTNL